jgi:hypothetical protein
VYVLYNIKVKLFGSVNLGHLDQILVKPWSDIGKILVKLGQTLVKPWSDLGQTLVRPWSDRGQMLVRPWSLLNPWSNLATSDKHWSNHGRTLVRSFDQGLTKV